jgi:hypothetical protein
MIRRIFRRRKGPTVQASKSIQREEWPDDFWRAFEGMPEGFERPVPVPQKREDLDPSVLAGP